MSRSGCSIRTTVGRNRGKLPGPAPPGGADSCDAGAWGEYTWRRGLNTDDGAASDGRRCVTLLLRLACSTGNTGLDTLAKIGLLSDSHGRAATTRRGVEVLLAHGVDVLIHLGDVGTVEVIDALVVPQQGHGDGVLEAHLVFGNTDWDADDLARYAADLGVVVDHPLGRLSVAGGGGGELMFCHGHESPVMAEAMAARPRYLCHGHTHKPLDVQRGPTRVINPGALFRAKQYTVAVLDPERDEVTILPLEES